MFKAVEWIERQRKAAIAVRRLERGGQRAN
jgi:hypothetical protein